MRRVLLDVTPLRVSSDFRRLWIGQAVSFLGSMITTAALPYQVYQQTGSNLAVGVLGVVQLGPLLVFSVVGGAVADSVDKRRLLLLVTTLSLTSSVALTVNASLDEPRLWVLYVLGAAASGVTAVAFSVVRSLLPLLLDPELRPAGYALQSTYGSFGMMAGPALAGVVIATRGLTTAYVIDVVTFTLALAVFRTLAPMPPLGDGRAQLHALRATMAEGLRFLQGHSVVLSIFGLDLLAMTFGMPKALFPALSEQLGGGPRLYGLLLSSVAAGMFVASVASGWTGRVRRQGRAVLVCVALWGGAIAVAGLVKVSAVVLVLFAVAGGADMISGVFRSTIAAAVTPDEMRGRVSGFEFAVYAGGPVLGDIEAGLVGGVAGVPFAIVSGGLACVVGAAYFATRVRSFATYTARSTSPSDVPPVVVAPGPASSLTAVDPP
jgi:MFS family permease